MDVIVVTPREMELLEILHEAGKALSRDEIAAIGGRERLSPHDFTLLNRLIEKNLIEHTVSYDSPGKGRYMYEAVK